MLYVESSKTLELRELARLAFRRNMEIGMVAVLSGGLALAVGLPPRLPASMTVSPIAIGLMLALIVGLELLFYLRWRSPPDKVIERFEEALEARRQSGTFAGVPSRIVVVLAGLLSFLFALGLAMVMPLGVRGG